MYANMEMDGDKSPPRKMKFAPANEDKYSTKTLQGNWYENRIDFKHPRYKHDSLYNSEYNTYKEISSTKDVVWDLACAGQAGVDPIVHPRTGCDDYPNFFQNFTSTTDLSYNHFPKWYKDDVVKRYYKSVYHKYFPMEEYLEPYHNMTNFGLVDCKRKFWCESISDPRKTINSMYKDSYSPPHKDCYEFPRWGRPKAMSAFISKTSETLDALKLRGWDPGFFVPTPSHPVLYKKRKTCNIFTWECPPEQKVCVPKHEWKNCCVQQEKL